MKIYVKMYRSCIETLKITAEEISLFYTQYILCIFFILIDQTVNFITICSVKETRDTWHRLLCVVFNVLPLSVGKICSKATPLPSNKKTETCVMRHTMGNLEKSLSAYKDNGIEWPTGPWAVWGCGRPQKHDDAWSDTATQNKVLVMDHSK